MKNLSMLGKKIVHGSKGGFVFAIVTQQSERGHVWFYIKFTIISGSLLAGSFGADAELDALLALLFGE